MRRAIALHWPEYLSEAAGLGLFMLSACAAGLALYHPASPIAAVPLYPLARRALMGLAMGLTAVGLVYSPWGRRSGAHLNPAVTLSFWRLDKVAGWDAIFYVVAQVAGGAAGILISGVASGGLVAHPALNYLPTLPGDGGVTVAFVAEVVISFGLMTVVLATSNAPRLARFTGLFAGSLVALYITLEAPLSGMSMNPARTFASALGAHVWTGFWVYLTAPPLGMLLAVELHRRRRASVICAKLHHDLTSRCIFRCGYQQ